jgi:predicted nucleic acid-binding protein
MKAFIDTNIFIYALESHPEYGARSHQILDNIDTGKDEGYTSTLVLMEICWYLEADRNYNRMKQVTEQITKSRLYILNIKTDDILKAVEMKNTYTNIDLNDLINYTLLKREDLKHIYTNDAHYRKLPETELHF